MRVAHKSVSSAAANFSCHNAPLVVLPLHIHKPAGSICSMKRNTHVFIPEGQFRLLSGADNLACYQVGVPAWQQVG